MGKPESSNSGSRDRDWNPNNTLVIKSLREREYMVRIIGKMNKKRKS